MDKASKVLRELENYPLDKAAKGIFRVFAFNPKTGAIRKMIEKNNLILYSGADILAQVLVGKPTYAIDTMYLEFKNLPMSTDPITPPTFDRTGGIEYYTGLSSSPDVDFLRVPLTVSPLIDSSNAALYVGNQVTFFGISEGTFGFFGKPFNVVSNSAVYGAALVATPDLSDQSQDAVFSRAYAGVDKVLKETGEEIGVTWTIRFN